MRWTSVSPTPCFHRIACAFPNARRIVLTNKPVSIKAASLESVLGDSGLVDNVIHFSPSTRSLRELLELRERIRETGAIVRWANTGKQFPEMAASINQVELILGLNIYEVQPRKSFDAELFEPGPKGGLLMLRRGVPECSIRMKRRPLMAHLKTFPRPWEVNIGFNAKEIKRAEEFVDRNERPWCHWLDARRRRKEAR